MGGDLQIRDLEALPRCGLGLDRHLENLHLAIDDAATRTRTVIQQIRDAVAAHRRRVARLESRLAAVEPEFRGPISRALADARADLQAARAAEREATRAQDQSRGTVERIVSSSRQLGAQGKAELQITYDGVYQARGRFSAALMGLRAPNSTAAEFGAIAIADSDARLSAGVSAKESSDSPRAGESVGNGLVMVALGDIDDSDSTVRGPQSFNPDVLSYRDALVAAERLGPVVDAVRAGSGIDRLQQLDSARGSADSVASYARTFEGFFGYTAVALSQRSDGRYEVLNGYHRIYAARKAGIPLIPARVRRA